MAFVLRYYQENSVNLALNLLTEKSSKNRKGLLVLPTGAGKSIIIAEICKKLNGKVLIFQPSTELLRQNVAKYKQVTDEPCSIFSASAGSKELSHVTFATIGSVFRLGCDFKKFGFKYVIIDEAHEVGLKRKSKDKDDTSSMYQKFFTDLGVKKVVGLTATPFRNHVVGNRYGSHTESKFLTKTSPKFFNEVLYVVQNKEMVENGWWKKIDYKYYEFDERNLKLSSTGRDYTNDSLKDWVERDELYLMLEDAIDILINKKQKKQIMVFLPSISSCETLQNRLGDIATVIHGTLKSDDRQKRLEDFGNQKYKVIINCEVLTTGYDNSEIDALIFARPTKSLSLYMQIIGRLVRVPKNNKLEGLVIDFTNNVETFGKVEDITIENIEGYGYGVFTKVINKRGDRMINKLLTNVDITNEFDVTKEECVKRGQIIENMKLTPAKDFILPIGKHSGEKLTNVPINYLMWFAENLSDKYPIESKKILDYLESI